MAYITLSDLRGKSSRIRKAFSANESLGTSETFEKQIFLSYRRKDSDYVKPIVEILKNLGANVYIDYLDESLPEKPNTETDTEIGSVEAQTGTSMGKVLGAVLVGALLAASFVVGRFTAPTVVEVREHEIFIEATVEVEDTTPEDVVEINEVVPEVFEEVEPAVVPTPEK